MADVTYSYGDDNEQASTPAPVLYQYGDGNPPTVHTPGLAVRLLNAANKGLGEFGDVVEKFNPVDYAFDKVIDQTGLQSTADKAQRDMSFSQKLTRDNALHTTPDYAPQSAAERYAQSIATAAGGNAVPALLTGGATLPESIGKFAATELGASTGQGVAGQAARDEFPNNPIADAVAQVLGGVGGGVLTHLGLNPGSIRTNADGSTDTLGQDGQWYVSTGPDVSKAATEAQPELTDRAPMTPAEADAALDKAGVPDTQKNQRMYQVTDGNRIVTVTDIKAARREAARMSAEVDPDNFDQHLGNIGGYKWTDGTKNFGPVQIKSGKPDELVPFARQPDVIDEAKAAAPVWDGTYPENPNSIFGPGKPTEPVATAPEEADGAGGSQPPESPPPPPSGGEPPQPPEEPEQPPTHVGNINIAKGGYTPEQLPYLEQAASEYSADPQTHAEILKQAVQMKQEMSPEELIAFDPLKSEAVAHSVALRAQLNESVAKATQAAADLLDPTKDTTAAQQAFDEAMNTAGFTANAVSDGAKFAGRLLNAHGISVGPDGKFTKAIGDLAGENTADMAMDPQTRLKLAQQVLSYKNNPTAINTLAKNAVKPYAEDYVAKLWYNFALSNPKTWQTTLQDNAQQVMQRVAENKLATVAGTMSKEEFAARQAAMQQGISDAASLFSGNNPMVQGIKQAFSGGHPVTGAASHSPYVSANLGPLEWTSFGPKIISSIDQFYRQLAANMETAGLAVRKAQSEGLSGPTFDQRVTDLRTSPTKQMIDAANEAARSVVYADNLTGIAGAITKAQARLPDMNPLQRATRFGAMMLAPFPRVEFNIAKNIIRSSPLGYLDPATQAAIKMGGVPRAVAYARMGIGTGVIAGLGTLAANGDLTPKGIKIGDNIYSYDNTRLGTTAKLVATAVDEYQKGRAKGESLYQGLSNGLGSLISDMAEDTWFADTAKFMELFQKGRDGEQARQDFINQKTGSLVPAIVAGAEKTIDPNVHDTSGGVGDYVKSRIPGLANEVPVKHDVYGNPETRDYHFLTGTTTTPVSTDPVQVEIDRLNKTAPNKLVMPTPSKTLRFGNISFPLTPDEKQELQAEGGKNVHDALSAIINTPSWAQLPDKMKMVYIKQIQSQAKKAAEGMMIQRKLQQQQPTISMSGIPLSQPDDGEE